MEHLPRTSRLHPPGSAPSTSHDAAPAPVDASVVGTVLGGRYRIGECIGAGAMGVVWTAWDRRLRRTVAIKQLAARGRPDAAEEPVARARAMREGRIAARVVHPRAIAVFDVVVNDAGPWLVMEYLPSRSLAAVLAERGPLEPGEAAWVGAQIADALGAVHEAGIVHGDIKPGNILLTDDGVAKITDFGVSRATWDTTSTGGGTVAGTPGYFAPEVARGGDPTPASDVFSLGATLYAAVENELVCGRQDNTLAVLHAMAEGRLRPATRAGVLGRPLAAMLRLDPGHRPGTGTVERALRARAGSPPAIGTPASATTDTRTEAPEAAGVPEPRATGTAEPGVAAHVPRSRTSGTEDAPAVPTAEDGAESVAGDPADRTTTTGDAPDAESPSTRSTGSAGESPATGEPSAPAAAPSTSTPDPGASPPPGRSAVPAPTAPALPPLPAPPTPAAQGAPGPGVPAAGAAPTGVPWAAAGPDRALARRAGTSLLPASTVASPSDRARRRPTGWGSRRRVAAVAAVSGVVLAAGVGVAVAAGGAGSTVGAAPAPAATSPTEPAPSDPLGGGAGTSSSPTTTPRVAEPLSPSDPGAPSGEDPGALVVNYYASLPGDIDGAWTVLSPGAREDSGGYEGYRRFWSGIEAVRTSDVTVHGDTVTADIEFTTDSGRTSHESYQFDIERDDAGKLRIERAQRSSNSM